MTTKILFWLIHNAKNIRGLEEGDQANGQYCERSTFSKKGKKSYKKKRRIIGDKYCLMDANVTNFHYCTKTQFSKSSIKNNHLLQQLRQVAGSRGQSFSSIIYYDDVLASQETSRGTRIHASLNAFSSLSTIESLTLLTCQC